MAYNPGVMRRSPLLYWLTALALVLGQWSLLAHATEHTIESAHDGLCVVCVQGHSLEQMQLSGSDTTQITAPVYPRAGAGPLHAASTPANKPNIRGPPLLR